MQRHSNKISKRTEAIFNLNLVIKVKKIKFCYKRLMKVNINFIEFYRPSLIQFTRKL